MGELIAAMRAGREHGLVGLTFDDGYVNVLDIAVPELRRHGFTATMFIISDLLGKTNEWEDAGTPVWPLMSVDQVIKVAAAGMEIGSHTATHPRLRGIAETGFARRWPEVDRSSAICLASPSRVSPIRSAAWTQPPGKRFATQGMTMHARWNLHYRAWASSRCPGSYSNSMTVLDGWRSRRCFSGAIRH